ncbi:MAG: gamma-glutamyltransferase [Arenicellales bacterium]|jgi:gamma-glutamyltranspeptidase/glutathione hydrolase|nr:gamma-glutamyltransferase [Arenicellales bacterium]MDP6552826.1 gamma-glutamyltransferase [Arenicellales bacterium]MDP6918920.1 gamma-glutamyltransferase [Arenicellales bacterium]|tara:strand:- start:4552 stop:6120 length:1569 start_codon:yes stop_codon:yes gene_type:complete
MEHWSIAKPAVHAEGGVVVSQHYQAAEAGVRVLAQGGNAVDAAIAAGFALGTVEPWMSGLGGCGFMTVYLADTGRSYAIEFGVRSSAALDPKDYPLGSGFDSDLFAWPGVLDNRNVLGPYSVAVPGYVAGVALAAKRFATLSWDELLSPAIELARQGLTVDWYSSLKIASSAQDIAGFESTRSVYLPDGQVPMGHWAGAPPVIELKGLAQTLQQLADEGPDGFYRGDLARRLLCDAEMVGIGLTADDLAAYEAECHELPGFTYRDAMVYTPTGLCGGPSMCDALDELARQVRMPGDRPDGDFYCAVADGLNSAYAHRLTRMGDSPDGRTPGCTTHLNVTDRDGNVVALTQTLLSVFGSRLLLPDTGILMNNGVMWFDPTPGRPNSLAPAKRPLSNMCPAIVKLPSGVAFAAGASGGRRIVSSVMQLISFMTDFGMDPEQAMRQPRIDVEGSDNVLADTALDDSVIAALRQRFENVTTAQHGVYPSLFGCPSIASVEPGSGRSTGAAFVTSPLAAAVGEHAES